MRSIDSRRQPRRIGESCDLLPGRFERMIAGILLWTLSDIRFNAEMGLLLALWMGMSFLASVTLLPACLVTFAPKFLGAGRNIDAAASARVEKRRVTTRTGGGTMRDSRGIRLQGFLAARRVGTPVSMDTPVF
ncbi:MAG: hypothetical protein ACREQQ_16655 [Candidatus Binatia bacterium]